jgi:hypothetical protein
MKLDRVLTIQTGLKRSYLVPAMKLVDEGNKFVQMDEMQHEKKEIGFALPVTVVVSDQGGDPPMFTQSRFE